MQLIGRHKKLFFPCAGFRHINRWEDTLIRDFTVEDDFAITCAFKFFEDNFVHARSCINQGRRNNRQRAALFNISRCAKETFWALERIRIDAAC